MKGSVDELGRALVSFGIRADEDLKFLPVTAWIDTAFNGELVLPRRTIDDAKLKLSAVIEAKLADGSSVMLETYGCIVKWFNQDLRVEVIANDGEFPLIGIGLLIGHRLIIDYGKQTVTIK